MSTSSGVTVSMSLALDMTDLDLNRLYANAWQFGLLNDTNTVFNGKTYEDLYVVDWQLESTYYESVFGGSGMGVDANQIITGGTISGYLETYWDGSSYVPYFAIENTSVAALDIWAAAVSSSTSDDDVLLEAILAGADSITGSSGSDVLVGYAGNDKFYSTTGSDRIYGGLGLDRFYASSDTRSTITVEAITDGFKVTSPTSGIDYLYSVENIVLSNETVSLSDFVTSPITANESSSGVTVSMSLALDMTDLDLNRLYANAWQFGLLNDTNTVFNGKTYEDLYVVDWQLESTYYESVFGGSGMGVDANQIITGGTISGYLETYWDGSSYVPYFAIENTSVAALDIWAAAVSSSTSDDDVLLEAILAGADSITGSSGSDVLVGYAGNDKFYSTTGSDRIYGGLGLDRFYASSDTRSTITVEAITDGFKVTSPTSGIDYLYSVENIVLSNETVSLMDLTGLDGEIVDAVITSGSVSRKTGDYVVASDNAGSFLSLKGLGSLMVVGGHDSLAGRPFKGVYTSRSDSPILSPLTTIVHQIVEAGSDSATAITQVTAALGLSSSFSLDSEVAATELDSGDTTLGRDTLGKIAMVSLATQLGSGGDPMLGLQLYSKLATSVSAAADSGEIINLTDVATLTSTFGMGNYALSETTIQTIQSAMLELNLLANDGASTLTDFSTTVSGLTASLANNSFGLLRFWNSDTETWKLMPNKTISGHQNGSEVFETTTSALSSIDLAPHVSGNYNFFVEGVDTRSAINISDAVSILKDIVGLTPLNGFAEKAADVNGDGQVNISDAVSTLKIIVGLEDAQVPVIFDHFGQSDIALDGSSNYDLYAVILGDVDGSGVSLL